MVKPSDLPLPLSDEMAIPAPSVRAASPGPSGARPFWMRLAWLLGRVRPSLRAESTADADVLRRFPRWVVEVVPVLLVLAIAGGFAGSHGMHFYQNAKSGIEWGRFGLADTYLEIPVFLFAAILIGQALPSLAALLVVVFGVLDTVVAATQAQELTPLPGALVGRLVAIWALWLLAVEVPVFARYLARSWGAISRFRPVATLLVMGTAGISTWAWTQAAPILIRPMFVWSDLGSPAVAALRPVQEAGEVFAIWAAIVAGAVTLLRDPSRSPTWDAGDTGSSGKSGAISIVRGLLVAALLTICLGGLIASPIEGFVLFAAIAGSRPLAQLVADRTILGDIIRRVPPPIRLLAAGAASVGASWLVVAPLRDANLRANIGSTDNSFFSVVFAIALAFFVVALVTTPRRAPRRPSGMVATATTLLAVIVPLQLVMLALPVTVLADNCASLNDCWDTVKWTVLAAAALPFLMAYGAVTSDSSFRHKNPPPRPDPNLYPPPPPWKKDPYMWPGGDHYPPDGHALHSAGGTRA